MKGARAITDDEARRTVEQFKSWRDRLLFLLCLHTGARISEALALRLDQVIRPGANNSWEVVGQVVYKKRRTKGKKSSRAIAMHEELAAALDRYLARERGLEDLEGPLFPSRHGGALSRSQATRLINDAFEAAGVKDRVSTHSLRKTFAQRIYQQRRDLPLLQELLGHASIAETRKYVEVDEEDLHEAVHALDGTGVDDLPQLPEKPAKRDRSRSYCAWIHERAKRLLEDGTQTHRRKALRAALNDHRRLLVPVYADRADWLEQRVATLTQGSRPMPRITALRRARAEWVGQPVGEDKEAAK